jgi:deferrochelatase/peroxidase EfeB
MTAERIQPGVYFRSGERPPPAFRLVLLNAVRGAGAAPVRAAIGEVLAMLRGLPRGRVRDLPRLGRSEAERTARQFDGLTALVGYGARLFDGSVHDPPLTTAPRPAHLAALAGFRALPWESAGPNRGDADVALQLTARHAAAVDVAAVEVAKLVADRGLPLSVAATFGGHGRADRRGWLDFHDGISNLPSEGRPAALVARGDPPWMAGGTYMAFLRLPVDLAAWRSLSRSEQELLVGRDKHTGSALTGVRRTGDRLEPVAGGDFVDPPQTNEPALEASHVHRANQSRASADAPAAHRIFRQGYDYLEDLGPDGPRLGLNFVSFQADLAALVHLLHLPGWLGDVNFGGRHERGPGEPPPLAFVALAAGGLYAVPPRARPFPGAGLFD